MKKHHMKRSHSPRSRSSRPTHVLTCALPGLWLSACLPATGPSPVGPQDADLIVAQDSMTDLEADSLARLVAEVNELRERAVRAELSLVQRDAEIRQLEERLDAQQKMLDETIEEIVRAKGRLRGMENKAQAASQLAEAEIALKTLRDLPGGGEVPEYGRAAELIESGTREFTNENYGGAIYLGNQAKTIISLAQARIEDRRRRGGSGDEVSFQAPLPLAVSVGANVRDGPGLDHDVITVLPGSSQVVGYSYKGEWVRVRLEDGREGWIHQTLLRSR